ncbi:tudor domain-containing protein 5-like isoform X2 [Patiria miniata]|uniref:Tudor domain-containing protein 5 n=1 Tax=Patiria miniata TaxID=46514 RepID=A0A914AJB8_PATMI|nr:tudor domain-containing protein 5-like isoform X2 [Patiria miniata]
MTDQAKVKETVKKTIRGLVVSAPLGLTPHEVELDYASFVGRPLPYRQLGYNTCQDFLQDIPDTVRPQWERGQLIVRVVGGGDSIRRIQSLVSRQKVDVVKCLKKRRGAARAGARIQHVQRDGYSYSPWRPGMPGGVAGQTRSSLPGIAFNSRPQPRGPPAVTPAVPAYVRNQIKTLLIAHPSGVLNSEFDRLFEEKFGHTICCTKLGFESLGHMCQMLSDFVSLEKVTRGEFRIFEKSHYKNRSPEVNNVKQIRQENNVSSIPESRKLPLATNSVEQKQPNKFQQNVVPNGPIHNPTKTQRSPPPQNAGFANSTMQSERQTKRQAPDTRPKIPSNSSVSPPGNSNDMNAIGSAEACKLTSDLFETKFLLEIRQVLEQHPEGLWASYLPDEYKKLYKKALPMMSLGYYSVTELMANMPEVVVIEREQKQGDWKLYDVRTYKPKTVESTKPTPTPQSLKTSQPDPSHGFRDLKEKVRHLLEKHTEGVLLKNMAFYYQREFGETFPIKELGFRDVESLIMMMPEIAKVVYKGYGRLVVVLVEETSMKQKGSFPADAVAWGFSYNYCEYPPVREYIEVYVATVFTPHRISIQLKEKRRNDALDNLMDDLESIYAYPEGNKYEFPESMVAVGQVCCALYLSDNNWHRGLITGIPNVDFIEVLYVDYGTVANVTRSSLRLLKSCFLRLPIQAYNGRLAYIAPVEDKWTKESRDLLLSLTAGKPLIAMITEIQNDQLYLLLSDTSTEEDVHINDALVEAGLARFARPEGELNESLPPLLTEDEMPEPDMDLLTLNDVVATETDADTQQQDADTQHHDADTQYQDANRQHQDAERQLQEEVPSAPEEEAEADLPSEESGSSSMPHLETSDDVPWLIKRIDFDDGNQAHLINHDNEACLCVAEVAFLMCGRDESEPEEILIQQVSMLGVEIPLLTAIEKESPRLFEEMRRCELLDRSEESPDLVAMIPFTDALLLLSACDKVSMEVVQQLQEKAEMLGVFGDMFGYDIGDTAGDDLDLMLDPEELKTILEALQFRRKRILDAMMKNTDANYVDELSYIEAKMEEISRRHREAS